MMDLPRLCQNSKGLDISKEDMQESIRPSAKPKSGRRKGGWEHAYFSFQPPLIKWITSVSQSQEFWTVIDKWTFSAQRGRPEGETCRSCYRNSGWTRCVLSVCNPSTVRKRQETLGASLVYTVTGKTVGQTKILSQSKEESGEQEAFRDSVALACSQDSEQALSLAVLSCLVWQHPFAL